MVALSSRTHPAAAFAIHYCSTITASFTLFMKILFAILFAALFILTGCLHGPEPTVFVREVPVQVTSTNTLDVIRFPASYRAYTVGRRVDPGNPGFMHEAHMLYIRESPDRWNLRAPSASTPVPMVPAAPE